MELVVFAGVEYSHASYNWDNDAFAWDKIRWTWGIHGLAFVFITSCFAFPFVPRQEHWYRLRLDACVESVIISEGVILESIFERHMCLRVLVILLLLILCRSSIWRVLCYWMRVGPSWFWVVASWRRKIHVLLVDTCQLLLYMFIQNLEYPPPSPPTPPPPLQLYIATCFSFPLSPL